MKTHAPPALQVLLEAETERYLARAEPLFRQAGRAAPTVELAFDLRGRAAGQVVRRQGRPLRIRYNLAIAQGQPEAFLAETVPHEVAHVVTAICHRRARPHGPEWRSVMRWFGIAQAARCHRFEVPAGGRRQRRWPYRCGCGEHQLSTTRHHRVLHKGTRYLCRRCGETLSYQP